ncbi:pyridoxal phosphate-dependent transferase [Lipomyces oligophaga]|uniref:pyridoxal phosphate-dependent transferase n=1 Tax=Lipomyces oligophaga TaxID=45792 RepID=UPI0034CFAD0F
MTIQNSSSSAFNLKAITRPNIYVLEPYRCARDDYKTGVLLDANENAYGPALVNTESAEFSVISSDTLAGLNRYPDPHQEEVKQLICNLRNLPIKDDQVVEPLKPANIYVGVGSDECIDTIIRCFCSPGKDKMLTCPPTYGMYAVSAQINDIEVVKVPQDPANGFDIRTDAVMEALSNDPSIHLLYLCSPGNPTASLVDRESVKKILKHPTWNGIVVVDEAYVDFAPVGSSLAPWVTKYDNLIVLQTLSKAFGMAGIRFGISYTSHSIATILNAVKAPYNVSTITSELAIQGLSVSSLSNVRKNISYILTQRDRLLRELPLIPGIGNFIGGHDSNFLLVQILDKPAGQPSNIVANKLYESLAQNKGVVVRFRGKEYGCLGALRITVGTGEENTILLEKIREALMEIYKA